MKHELNSLSETPDLVVGTPGRIVHHLKIGSIDFSSISILVIDEYDKSLELGFEEDLSKIISHLNSKRLTILSSASQAIVLPEFMHFENPKILDYRETGSLPQLSSKILRSDKRDKPELLLQLISYIGVSPTLIFCNHREAVERIGQLLLDNGVDCETYHGGYEQSRRERALIRFRNGSRSFLVTTDLASRGLDIPEIANIVHYQRANTAEAYLHRNGRTARMMREGVIWHLIEENDILPEFINPPFAEEILPDHDLIFQKSRWETIYIGGGKKNKISKTDVVGMLIYKGGLTKEEIGLITVLDSETYVAVPKEKAIKLVGILKVEKIKGMKLKIAVAE